MLLCAVLTACFSGVDSTPRIQPERGSGHAAAATAEEQFLRDIRGESPAQWTVGKGFVVADGRFALLLGNTAPHRDITDERLSLIGLANALSVTGDSVTDVRLAGVQGDTLVYRVNLPLTQLKIREDYSIPFLVEESVVEACASRLLGRTLWLKTRERGDGRFGRRFIPVTVDSVHPGTEVFPVRVFFHAIDNAEDTGSLLVEPGPSPGPRHSFAASFFLENPRRLYPSIDDRAWEAVMDGRVIEGMTPEQVKLSIGAPSQVRNRDSESIMRREWVYPNGRIVRFENGFVVL